MLIRTNMLISLVKTLPINKFTISMLGVTSGNGKSIVVTVSSKVKAGNHLINFFSAKLQHRVYILSFLLFRTKKKHYVN